MHSASRPAACMPAVTLSRRAWYSAAEICGNTVSWGAFRVRRLVGCKLPHRVRDLLRAGHEELLLRPIEGHRRDVRCGDTDHRPVQVLERVLRDDGRDLRSKTACQIVFVYDHRLSRFAHRPEDGLSI